MFVSIQGGLCQSKEGCDNPSMFVAIQGGLHVRNWDCLGVQIVIMSGYCIEKEKKGKQ